MMLDGVALPLKDQVLSLRVLLDQALLLDKQVESVARSAFYQERLDSTRSCLMYSTRLMIDNIFCQLSGPGLFPNQ